MESHKKTVNIMTRFEYFPLIQKLTLYKNIKFIIYIRETECCSFPLTCHLLSRKSELLIAYILPIFRKCVRLIY